MRDFIVVEGDNASGKTTLAQSLKTCGFVVVSEDSELAEMKLSFKNLHGRDKMQAFYRYNMLTAQKALDSRQATPLVVRYWVSTLAAAFADKLIDFGEMFRQLDDNIKNFPSPAAFVYLNCNYDERLKRIKLRRKTLGFADDNRSKTRSKRYRRAIMEISISVPVPWIFIPSDVLDVAAVKETFLSVVNNFRGLNS